MSAMTGTASLVYCLFIQAYETARTAWTTRHDSRLRHMSLDDTQLAEPARA